MCSQVVKRVVVLGLDGNQEGKARVGALLTTLSANGLVTLEAMKKVSPTCPPV